MHGALFDWDNAIRSAFKVAHDESASARSRTENERDFLPKALRKREIHVYLNEQRRRNRPSRFTQGSRKAVQQRRLL